MFRSARTGEIHLRTGKVERPSAGRVFGGAQDAGEPRGVERRGGGLELGDVDVQTVKVLRPRDDGQSARSVLRHGAVPVLQLHVVRLLERTVRRRVSVCTATARTSSIIIRYYSYDR